MNQSNDAPICPLCGHDGRKEVTQRPMEFQARQMKATLLTLFKCRTCGTTFTNAECSDPLRALQDAV